MCCCDLAFASGMSQVEVPQKLIVSLETRLRGVLQDVTARLGEAKHVAMPTVVAHVMFGAIA